MKYICNCSDVSLGEWEELMKDNYPIDYQELVSKIKCELPRLYKDYILVHSAIEYFIEK